jgi:hypothetical protein
MLLVPIPASKNKTQQSIEIAAFCLTVWLRGLATTDTNIR